MKKVVFSNYTNAWTLKKGLNKLGFDLSSVDHHSKLVPHIDEEQLEKGDALFFTEESSLKKFMNSNHYFFEPRIFDIDLLDDKLTFANYLVEVGEIPIPSRGLTENEKEFPFYLKCRHSWMDGLKLPRGYIVNSKAELAERLKDIQNNNWNVDWFFNQRLLNSNTENNISTSGYFDYQNNQRNLIIVSKKTMGSSSSMPTGSAVETIEDPANLLERTINLLNKMRYQGPFELEFLYEQIDNTYYVLELNPRFWMQHGIFIDLYNNGLIKRYLHLENEKDWIEKGIPDFKHIIWIDSIFFLFSMFRFDIPTIKRLLGLKGDKVFYPSLSVAFRFSFSRIGQIIKNKIKN